MLLIDSNSRVGRWTGLPVAVARPLLLRLKLKGQCAFKFFSRIKSAPSTLRSTGIYSRDLNERKSNERHCPLRSSR